MKNRIIKVLIILIVMCIILIALTKKSIQTMFQV